MVYFLNKFSSHKLQKIDTIFFHDFTDNKEAIAFLLLPYEIGVLPLKGKANQERYRPTLVEVQKSMILYLDVDNSFCFSSFLI